MHTLAIIPEYHKNGHNKFCSIQVITKDNSWNIPFPYDEFNQNSHHTQMGPNYFGEKCFFPDGSLVLSVADIPIGLFSFTGTIAVIMWQDKEYRFATYLRKIE